VFGDPTYADAVLDRNVHNARRLNLTGHMGATRGASECKIIRQRDAAALATSCRDTGRHHYRCPGDFVGIRMNSLNPKAYLRDVFSRIGNRPINRIDELPP
jgi:hypothetical protein